MQAIELRISLHVTYIIMPSKLIQVVIPSSLARRCNGKEASKRVNDLLTGLLSMEQMRRTTLTGHCGDGSKEQLDPDILNAIIGKHQFVCRNDLLYLIFCIFIL